MGEQLLHLEVKRSKVEVMRSQIKTVSVSQHGTQLVAPPDE